MSLCRRGRSGSANVKQSQLSSENKRSAVQQAKYSELTYFIVQHISQIPSKGIKATNFNFQESSESADQTLSKWMQRVSCSGNRQVRNAANIGRGFPVHDTSDSAGQKFSKQRRGISKSEDQHSEVQEIEAEKAGDLHPSRTREKQIDAVDFQISRSASQQVT